MCKGLLEILRGSHEYVALGLMECTFSMGCAPRTKNAVGSEMLTRNHLVRTSGYIPQLPTADGEKYYIYTAPVLAAAAS